MLVGDILSQNEIDDLMQALDSGEIDLKEEDGAVGKKLKAYDFRHPSKFAKEHLRTLHIINESYARLVATHLSGQLRTLVQLEVVSVEPIAYYEFNNSLSGSVILAVVDFSPLNGSIIIDISPGVAFAFVDRILGGKGTQMEKIRDFTEIEVSIVEKMIIQLIKLMKEPWKSVVEITPKLQKIETNAQFAQYMSPNEMVAMVSFNITIGEAEGLINFCIPYLVVEPIIPKLSTKIWFSTSKKEEVKCKDLIESKIQSIYVPIKAVMGRTEITVNEISGLSEGDVISIDTGVNDKFEVFVGDSLKFYGKPGIVKNKMAIKITDVLRGEEL